MYDRDVLHLSFSQRWHYLFVSVNQRQLLNLSRQAAPIPERASTRFSAYGNPLNAPTVKPVRVSADDHSAEFTFDVISKTQANMGWHKRPGP
jgi:hypothetical protein